MDLVELKETFDLVWREAHYDIPRARGIPGRIVTLKLVGKASLSSEGRGSKVTIKTIRFHKG